MADASGRQRQPLVDAAAQEAVVLAIMGSNRQTPGLTNGLTLSAKQVAVTAQASLAMHC